MKALRVKSEVPIYELRTEEEHKKQLEKQEEFLTSFCDLFSGADFRHYAEVTGKGLSWVMRNAKYHSENGIYGTCLENAVIDTDLELAEILI